MCDFFLTVVENYNAELTLIFIISVCFGKVDTETLSSATVPQFRFGSQNGGRRDCVHTSFN